MSRSLITTTAVAAALALALSSEAEAGKRSFGINVGGVRISTGGGGGQPSIRIGSGGKNFHVGIPVRPPVTNPIHPPVVIRPPVIKPPVVCPKPPIVIRPPVITPPPVVIKPPVVCPPPVVVKPPVITPPPVVIHPPVITPPPVVCPPPVVVEKPPVVLPPPVVVEPPVCHCQHVCTCEKPIVSPWYFGMACERVQSTFGLGLRITALTPNGPAATYGLKVGDVLLVAGSSNLSQATSNEHGTTLIQSGVTAEGTIQFTLVDSATGQLANLAMAPTPNAAPAPTTAESTTGAVALNPAEATSTM